MPCYIVQSIIILQCVEQIMRRGFSLVELLIVIVVIGILAVGAYPLIGTDSEADAATRQAELMGLLRLQQLTAMQNTGTDTAYGVTITGAAVNPQPTAGDNSVAATQLGSFTVSQAGVNLGETTLLFDGLGCPYQDDGSGGPTQLCAETSGFEVTIGGVGNRQVCLAPQGYIRPMGCQ